MVNCTSDRKKGKILASGTVTMMLGIIIAAGSFGLPSADAASAYYASNTTITSNSAIMNGEIWIIATGATLTIAPDVTVTNDGTIINYGTIVNQGTIINVDSFTNRGIITNKSGATLGNSQSSDPGGHYGSLSNYGTITNEAGTTFFNTGSMRNLETGNIMNFGILNNIGEGTLSNSGTWTNGNAGTIGNSFIIYNKAYLYNFGTVNNNFSVLENTGIIYNYCGTMTSSVPSSGNPVEDMCYPNAPVFPATHMEDTTSTYGLSLYSTRQAHVEMVTPTSELVGDSIDQIILKLRRTGDPPGMMEVGVFNPDLTVKKLFAVEYATNVTSTYTEYTFSLPNNELYTIQANDRIGIKYKVIPKDLKQL